MTGPDGELIPPQAGSTQDVCAPPERRVVQRWFGEWREALRRGPLNWGFPGADDEIRTRDPHLGKASIPLRQQRHRPLSWLPPTPNAPNPQSLPLSGRDVQRVKRSAESVGETRRCNWHANGTAALRQRC